MLNFVCIMHRTFPLQHKTYLCVYKDNAAQVCNAG
jgi:hypothetical protein